MLFQTGAWLSRCHTHSRELPWPRRVQRQHQTSGGRTRLGGGAIASLSGVGLLLIFMIQNTERAGSTSSSGSSPGCFGSSQWRLGASGRWCDSDWARCAVTGAARSAAKPDGADAPVNSWRHAAIARCRRWSRPATSSASCSLPPMLADSPARWRVSVREVTPALDRLRRQPGQCDDLAEAAGRPPCVPARPSRTSASALASRSCSKTHRG